jgi:acetylornithine/succinyldiaminopimelate/putrescine aminotransferase
LSLQAQWSRHASQTCRNVTARPDFDHPLAAHRCTVQLSTGQLYLDAVASPATALLGHDLPLMPATDAPAVRRMLLSLAPGYACLAMMSSFAAAARFAARLGRSATCPGGRVVEINALRGEPPLNEDFLVVHENETVGRTGSWLASVGWSRAPHVVVVGEALALGYPFGAVLARGGRAGKHDAPSTALQRVAAAIAAVENEGLLRQGREVADYLMSRLRAIDESCPQIERVEGTGLSIRVAFRSPLQAAQIRRRMCERGVLAGVDRAGRLAIDPPLPLRIAEADVITGVLRASLLGLPVVSASACCGACEDGD